MRKKGKHSRVVEFLIEFISKWVGVYKKQAKEQIWIQILSLYWHYHVKMNELFCIKAMAFLIIRSRLQENELWTTKFIADNYFVIKNMFPLGTNRVTYTDNSYSYLPWADASIFRLVLVHLEITKYSIISTFEQWDFPESQILQDLNNSMFTPIMKLSVSGEYFL